MSCAARCVLRLAGAIPDARVFQILLMLSRYSLVILRRYRHTRTSCRVFIRCSLVVSHCMLSLVSLPPAQMGLAWSTWWPGQAPERRPVLGQGFARLKARTSAALRTGFDATPRGSRTANARAAALKP